MSPALQVRQRGRWGGGFTLLEVLVAVAIFGLIAAVAYPGMSTIIKQRETVDDIQRRLGELQLGFAMMEQDMSSLVVRPVRDGFGDAVAAVRGGLDTSVIEFTRRAMHMPGLSPVSGLERIEYHVLEGALWRRSWHALDRVQSTGYDEQQILKDVRAVSGEFHDGSNWKEFWPPASSVNDLSKMPRAVRIAIRFNDDTAITRVFGVDGS